MELPILMKTNYSMAWVNIVSEDQQFHSFYVPFTKNLMMTLLSVFPPHPSTPCSASESFQKIPLQLSGVLIYV